LQKNQNRHLSLSDAYFRLRLMLLGLRRSRQWMVINAVIEQQNEAIYIQLDAAVVTISSCSGSSARCQERNAAEDDLENARTEKTAPKQRRRSF
jgi:hypothetical protein